MADPDYWTVPIAKELKIVSVSSSCDRLWTMGAHCRFVLIRYPISAGSQKGSQVDLAVRDIAQALRGFCFSGPDLRIK
jgi:hypothetical protein